MRITRPVSLVDGLCKASCLALLLLLLTANASHAHLALVRQGDESVEIPETGDRLGHTVAAGDFDGDGYDDLASAAPFENNDITPGNDHGVVVINFGSTHGITQVGAQLLTVGAPPDVSVEFGFSLCVGNFNGDAYDDLAVGAPRSDVSTQTDAGEVFIYHGSAEGLMGPVLFIDQADAGGAIEADDLFGWSLASGNFNGDAYDDLAVGAVGENTSTGAVSFFDGSAGGITVAGATTVTQLSYGLTNTGSDQFGFALVAKDFKGDANDDLGIGVPYYDRVFPTTPNAGRVLVVEGSASGLSTTSAFVIDPESIGLVSQVDGHFGWAVTGGRYNQSSLGGSCQIVIGEPGHQVNVQTNAGRIIRVGVFAGAAGQPLTQDSLADEAAQQDDRFGSVLATARFAREVNGEFVNDEFDDIIVGTPNERLEFGNEGTILIEEAGLVVVVHGAGATFPGTLETYDIDQANGWHEKTREPFAHFGHALAVGQFDGSNWDNLAIGAPDADYRVWLDEECPDPDDSCAPASDPTKYDAGQTHVLAPWRQVLSMRARSAVAMNCAGERVFSVRPFDNVRVASTTKVMTLLLAAEAIESTAIDSSATFEVPPWIEKCVTGSQADLKPNEPVRLIDLMKMTSSVSGNDAAYTIADALTGFNGGYPALDECLGRTGVPDAVVAHIDNMNTKASQIGMSGYTHFNTPAGRDQTYDGDKNRSTADDMAILGRFAMLNSPLLASIVGTTDWEIVRVPPEGFFGPLDGHYSFGWLKKVKFYNPKANGIKSGGTKWGLNCGLFSGRMKFTSDAPVIASSYGTEVRKWSQQRGADMIELAFERGNCPYIPDIAPPPPPTPLAHFVGWPTGDGDKNSVFVQTSQEDSLTLGHTVSLPQPDGFTHTGSMSILHTSQSVLDPGEGGQFEVAPFARHLGLEVSNVGSQTMTLQIIASHPSINQVVMLDSNDVFTIPADTPRALDTFTLDIINVSSVQAADLRIQAFGFSTDFALNDATTTHTVDWTRDMPVYVDNLHVIVCGTDVSNPALVDLTIGDDVPTDAPVPIAPSGRGVIGWARNAPNPFNPRTRIDYALLAPARVTLEVFDVNGRRLDVLMANTPKPAGQHFVVWDGVDRRGQRAGSGVYYYRIRAGNEFRTGTMHLVK